MIEEKEGENYLSGEKKGGTGEFANGAALTISWHAISAKKRGHSGESEGEPHPKQTKETTFHLSRRSI